MIMFMPQPTNRPFFIGAAEHSILLALGVYHYLRANQLCRLLYAKGSLSYVYEKLRNLVEAGYLLRTLTPSRNRTGSAPFIYTYACKGYTYCVEALRLDLPARYHVTEQQQKSPLFLAHTLAVNDVLISIALLQKQDPDRFYIAQLYQERTLKQDPVKVQLASKTRSVVLDGWVDLQLYSAAGQSIQYPWHWN
jgi:hypothetical protein